MYEEVDTEADQWEAFLHDWGELFGGPVTTAEVGKALQQGLFGSVPDDIGLALEGPQRGTTVRLSKVLIARLGQRFGADNRRLERAASDRSRKLLRWTLCDDHGGCG